MQFIENKVVSLGSSIGYCAPALLTTAAFILANNEAKVKAFNYEQIPNIFTLFVGYPGTGKLVLVEQGATSPVLTVCGKNDSYLIGRATSSALVKQIAEKCTLSPLKSMTP